MQYPTQHVVGTFHLAEATQYTEHFECAAWYQQHNVEPGAYPITASWYQGVWYFGVTLPSTKGNSDFGTRFGGVPVGTSGYNEGVGEPSSYRLSLGRDYDFARRLLNEALEQHKYRRPVRIVVDPTVIEFTVETYVSQHQLHDDSSAPSWSVHPKITVRVPVAA